MAATIHGRQHRAQSLHNLEHDKAALARPSNPGSKKYPVKMVFLLAPYEEISIDTFVVKKYRKIEPIGSTAEVSLVLIDRHDNEQAFLRWLFDCCRVNKDHTGGKAPNTQEWRVCTTACRGTANKGGSWEAPSWDPAAPVTLGAYKEQVHEVDGKEKDPSRTGFIPGKTAKHSRRVLAVFAVCEVRLGSRDRRQEEGSLDGTTDITPLVGSWEDDEELFCPQPSSPSSPTPDARPVAASTYLPPPLDFFSPRPAGTESAPSRQDFSAIPSASTHPRRPSTAASSVVEVSSSALPGLAVPRVMGHQRALNQPATPPKRGTNARGAAEDDGSRTVRPADLTLERPAYTSEAMTPDPCFVDANDDPQEAFDVVGRKRKVLRPDQSHADGSPRASRPKRARKPTAKAQEAPGNRRARRV